MSPLKIIICLTLSFATFTIAFANESDELEESTMRQLGEEAAKSTVTETKLLLLGLRIDSEYSSGGSVTQGFSIPSVRLSAYGDLSKIVSYRFSAGQLREFTRLLLPQLVPVEAYVDVSLVNSVEGLPLSLRLGMFTPTFNPWWTPDLSDVVLPDYHEIHKALFLSRDIGFQGKVELGEAIAITAGFFNGTGIFAPNTNNARAVVGSATIDLSSEDLGFAFGAAGSGVFQSVAGSVNYRSDWTADIFASFDIYAMRLKLMLDVFTGGYANSFGVASPVGAAIALKFGIYRSLSAFGRFEHATDTPPSKRRRQHFQFGPAVELGNGLTAWMLYDGDDGGGGLEHSAQFRLRLVI